MTLSIIIPVYNIEPYLADCLDSVLACDLRDCEIILSMRESADGSERICNTYQEAYPLVRAIRQNGKGLSNARNCAMRVAKGKYYLFIDGDDSVDSSILDGLIARLRDGSITADVIVTDYSMFEHPAESIRPYYQIGQGVPEHTGMQFLPQMLSRRQCFWNVWRYIFRSDFLRENQITFLENMLSEDVDFTTSVFLAEPEIIFSHSPYYFYHVGRGGSLMGNPTLKRLRETVFVLSDSIARLRASDFRYADAMIAQYQFEYILNIALTVELDPSERASALEVYRDWDRVLEPSVDPLVNAGRLLVRVVGVKFVAWILHFLKMLLRRVRGRK